MTNLDKAPQNDVRRSQLGRAVGLGAARSGSGEWATTRFESVALVPLTIWFIFSVIHLASAPREAVLAWMSSPLVLALMVLLIAITFHHLQLGLKNVIDDYVHNEGAKIACALANKAFCGILGLVCIICALKIGL